MLLVLLALVPMLGLTLYVDREWRLHEADEVQEQALRLARFVAADHGRSIEVAREILFSLSHLPVARQAGGSACGEGLFSRWIQSSRYTNFGVIGPDGTLLCRARPVRDAGGLREQSHVRRAIQSGGFAIGDYQLDPVTNRGTVGLAYPVLDGAHRLQAVVFVTLDLGGPGALGGEVDLPEGATVTLFDHGGTILARRPEAERWVGRPALGSPIIRTILERGRDGTARAPDVDGTMRLFGFAPLVGSGDAGTVYVAVGISEEATFQEDSRLLVLSLAALGVAALVALTATWVGSDLFLLRRMRALVSATRRLSLGDLSARTGVSGGSAELSQLAKAFDDMATALQRRQAEVEQAGEVLREMNTALANAMPGISRLNREGRYVAVNAAYACMLGWEPDDLPGKPWASAVHPDDLATALDARQRMHRDGKAEFEGRAVRKDGSVFRRHVLMVKGTDHDGNLLGHHCFMKDISERKQAEDALRRAHEELEARVRQRTSELVTTNEALQTALLERVRAEEALRKLSSVVEQTADSVFITARDGRIEYVNPAFEALTGYSKEEVVGRMGGLLKSGEHSAVEVTVSRARVARTAGAAG